MNRKEICEVHAKNRARLMKSLTVLGRQIQVAIKTEDQDLEYSLVRTVVILRMAWMESSLSCLIYSKNNLTDNQVQKCCDVGSEAARWENVCDFMFRLHYLGGKQLALNRINLGVVAFSRYEALRTIIRTQLTPLIELRNKLAHGQWHIALTSDGKSKNPEVTSTIWTFGKKELLFSKTLTSNLVKVICQLLVSKANFEKVCDQCIYKIDLAVHEMDERYIRSLERLRKSAAIQKSYATTKKTGEQVGDGDAEEAV